VRQSLLSSLALSTAFVFAGENFVNAQVVSPQRAVPQIVTKDPDFELKILDYKVRRFVSQMIADPQNDWYSSIFALAQRYDDPRKLQYISDTIKGLMAHKDENVRAYSAYWAYYTLSLNTNHRLNVDVRGLTARLIQRVERDSSEDVRFSALISLGVIGRNYPAEYQKCFDTYMHAAEDNSSYVRRAVVFDTVGLAKPKDFSRVRAALEVLSKDSDKGLAKYALESLEDLDKKVLKHNAQTNPANGTKSQPSTTAPVIVPIPTNLKP
jgi:hypothetical protein